jgi:hypothetical protein
VATLYEYYNTDYDDNTNFYGATWWAQTFTPSTAHKITSVKLQLYRTGSPGTITVSIRATDGSGHPTGSDLCSGTINGNSLTSSYPGEWYEITLGSGYDLSASTKYAIVVRAPSGNGSNKLCWLRQMSSPTYAGGNQEISTNSGSSWTTYTQYDLMFEEWGESAATAKTSSDTGSGADAVASSNPQATLTGADIGSGVDAKATDNPLAMLTGSETGAGADAVVSLETPQTKSSSDAGSGVEGTPSQSAILVGSETGSGIEALISRLLADLDTGSGAEASSIEIEGLLKNLFASELGQGSDSLTAKIEMPTKGGGMKLWT